MVCRHIMAQKGLSVHSGLRPVVLLDMGRLTRRASEHSQSIGTPPPTVSSMRHVFVFGSSPRGFVLIFVVLFTIDQR